MDIQFMTQLSNKMLSVVSKMINAESKEIQMK